MLPFRHGCRFLVWHALAMLVCLSACGGGGGNADDAAQAGATSRAEFIYDCDIEGLNSVLTLQVEAIASSGTVWGTGATPDISAVIATGSVTYYTAGTLVSTTAQYTFRGENRYADMTRPATGERFQVEWIVSGQNLTLRANPFGPGPVNYGCVQRSSRRL